MTKVRLLKNNSKMKLFPVDEWKVELLMLIFFNYIDPSHNITISYKLIEKKLNLLKQANFTKGKPDPLSLWAHSCKL